MIDPFDKYLQDTPEEKLDIPTYMYSMGSHLVADPEGLSKFLYSDRCFA